ncbi:hypothetical protein COU61_01790, partial [Candidatus Pacearchaeota archaeon CG10_big_fil_rev_8_21_14_0_10_35_13]
MRPERNIIL